MPTEPTSSPQILRVPRSDDPESFVLLRVSRPRSAVLDFDLAGTEGENPYTGSVRHSRLKNLRAKNYHGSDDEWVQIVSYILGQLSGSDGKPDSTSGVEVSATIPGSENNDEDKEMVLIIRKRIQTITQRLGSIGLKQDDEQDIELFDWAGLAISRADALGQRFSSLTDHYRTAEDTIQQLNKQLQGLISAKDHHENQLIANFAQLLNEKKLKIRNQQRLLASANVDPVKVSEIQAAASERDRNSTHKNGRPKRGAREISKDETENEDRFERMEAEQAASWNREQDQETDDERRSTPEPLEEGDGITTDEESVHPSTEKDVEGRGVEKPSASNRPMVKEPAASPPRRELPFARRAPKKETQAQSHLTGEDAESTAGETDDDEL